MDPGRIYSWGLLAYLRFGSVVRVGVFGGSNTTEPEDMGQEP